MTEPLQRVRDKDGGEGRNRGKEREHTVLPLAPLSPTEKDRGLRGPPPIYHP